MKTYPDLPDSEFTVMKIIWSRPAPVSGTQIAGLAAPEHGWKPQTVHTFLNRLVEKGFLSTEKKGKERFYTPLVLRDAYFNQATERFMNTFYKNSLKGFMNAFFSGSVNEDKLSELEEWFEENSKNL